MEEESVVDNSIFQAHNHTISCCLVSKNNNFLISGSWDKTLKLWNLNTSELIQNYEGHTDVIKCCVLSSDENLLYSGSWDKTLKCW